MSCDVTKVTSCQTLNYVYSRQLSVSVVISLSICSKLLLKIADDHKTPNDTFCHLFILGIR